MFKTRTVLVLGAGASKPFGFPVGVGLRDELCNLTRIENTTIGHLRREGLSDDQIHDFQERFAKSLLPIDNFVARQPAFDEVARLCIAAALLPKENEYLLYGADRRSSGVINGTADWHQSLWLHMLTEVHEPSDIVKNKVKVITFNYDRSFEHFLLTSTKSTFGLDAEQARNLVERFFPYHMHGQLGDYIGKDAIPFGGERGSDGSLRNIRFAAKNLKLMPSVRPTADEHCRTEIFEWAEQVFFLGFAFDEMNCERLGLLRASGTWSAAHHGSQLPMRGTNLGMDEYQTKQAIARVHVAPTAMLLEQLTCLEAIQRWMPLLSR